jgi:FMN phosphatase YigB (HAD superfamily)
MYKLLSFDVYGTLINTPPINVKAFRLILEQAGASNIDALAFYQFWESHNIVHYREPYRSYREIERIKLSPLAFAGHSEFGGLNRWCHIWAYKDAAERFAVREKARKDGIWPPSGGQPGQTLVQENMLVVPSAFSPLH